MTPEDREFLIEARRHLVGLVGLIERRAGIPGVCRLCAGCRVCEQRHREQDDIHYAQRVKMLAGPSGQN